jgi:hypothetical protein
MAEKRYIVSVYARLFTGEQQCIERFAVTATSYSAARKIAQRKVKVPRRFEIEAQVFGKGVR